MSTGTKPGIQTSEFWFGVAVAVGTLIAALSDALSPRYAAIASAVVAGLYAIGRGQSKQGTS